MSSVEVYLVPLVGVEHDPFSGNGNCLSKSDRKDPCLWSEFSQFVWTQLFVWVSLRAHTPVFCYPALFTFCGTIFPRPAWGFWLRGCEELLGFHLGHLVEWYKVVGTMWIHSVYHIIFVNYLCSFKEQKLLIYVNETLFLPKIVNIYLFVHWVSFSPLKPYVQLELHFYTEG